MIMYVSVIFCNKFNQNSLSKLSSFLSYFFVITFILDHTLGHHHVGKILTPKGCGTGLSIEATIEDCENTNSKCSPLHTVISSLITSKANDSNLATKPSNEWTELEEYELLKELLESTNACNFFDYLDCLPGRGKAPQICSCNPALTDCYEMLKLEQAKEETKTEDLVEDGRSHPNCSRHDNDTIIQHTPCYALVGIPCQFRAKNENPAVKEVDFPGLEEDLPCTRGAHCVTIKGSFFDDADGTKANIDKSILDTSGGTFLAGFNGPVLGILRKRATKVCKCDEEKGWNHIGNGLCWKSNVTKVMISKGLIFYLISMIILIF